MMGFAIAREDAVRALTPVCAGYAVNALLSSTRPKFQLYF
jgi:hypothetical protein